MGSQLCCMYLMNQSDPLRVEETRIRGTDHWLTGDVSCLASRTYSYTSSATAWIASL